MLHDDEAIEPRSLEIPVTYSSDDTAAIRESTSGSGGYPSDDTAAICEVHDEWIRREIAGESLRDLCDDDLVLLPQEGPPVVGLENAAEWMSRGSTNVQFIEITERTIEIRGEVAALSARFRTCVDGPETGRTWVNGRHQWVLRRKDTRWCVSTVTWMLLPT